MARYEAMNYDTLPPSRGDKKFNDQIHMDGGKLSRRRRRKTFPSLQNRRRENFRKDRSRRRDQNRPRIVEIGAILAIFEPFEVLLVG